MAWIEIVLLTIIAAGVWKRALSPECQYTTPTWTSSVSTYTNTVPMAKASVTIGDHRICTKCSRLVARFDENNVCDNCKVAA